MSLKDNLLSSNRILLIDGGVSTHLEDKLIENDCKNGFLYKEFWSSSLLLSFKGRDLILEGHKDWIKVGANILSTVTYQCHYEHLLWPHQSPNLSDIENTSFAPKERIEQFTESIVNEMWRNGIKLANQAIENCAEHFRVVNCSDPSKHRDPNEKPSKVWVAASSGCYGAALANGAEYTGLYPGKDLTSLQDFHLRKIKEIIQYSPDAIAFETIPNCLEIEALSAALAHTYETTCHANDLPACMISLACKNESQLNDGTPVENVIKVILETIPASYVQAIGFNCCNCRFLLGLVDILIRQLVAFKQQRAIIIYPNSGEDWDAGNKKWNEGSGCISSHEMAKQIFDVVLRIEATWKRLSKLPIPVIVIGGCCRTRPQTIADLRLMIDGHTSKNINLTTFSDDRL